MRPLLLAAALLAALAIGCVDHRARSTTTPTGAVTEVSMPTGPAGSSTRTPTVATTPIPLTAAACRALVPNSEQPSAVVTVFPSAPRGGETVRITGAGLTPGSYVASMGIPLSDGVVLSGLSLGTVGAAGVLDATFTMPSVGSGYCLVLAISPVGVGAGTAGKLAHAHTFIAGGNVVTPGACESLPDAPLPAAGRRARLSPPPYRVGDPITVTGEGLRVDVGSVEASLRVYYAPSTDTRLTGIEADSVRLDGTGSYTVTFTPRSDPRLSGICVEIVIGATADRGVGAPYGLARFTYP